VLSGARLVVADEPTAELDAESSARVLEAVRALAARGVAVVLATHDPAVRAIADEAVELDHGRNRRPEEPRHREIREALEARRAPGDGEVVARADAVSKSFHHAGEEVQALEDVSLEVRAGALTALVGRSGSGKTTLLNLLAGWETPDGGRVEVPGPAWADVAVLPQRFGLLAELTVRENVEYPLRLARRPGDGRVEELLDALALADLADRFPHEASIGQQQRAALCRALVVSPRLLLVDEPTGHQDAASALAVAAALRDAADAGTACLVATHDEELAGLCDVVVPLAGGRVAARPV
jgi:ABC-type lipoprotein export system ATPase subunit